MIRIGDALVAYALAGASPADAPWLSARELERAARLEGVRRTRFVEGRRILRELVSAIAPGADPAIEARCERCGSTDHGAPRATAAPVVVSLSYSGGLVAAAAAPSAVVAALGIDVEAGPPDEVLGDLVALFAPSAPPTRRRWTAIEAAVKADGRGLNVSPERVAIAADRAVVPGRADPLEVRDAGAPAGYTATLAFAR
ncbi:hypothetical protein GCM10010922_08390 [Microbacterium sorbitolivorans]|uniref:4-phosphopantetheinyl transferase n=1 Tax=Microbacterium sorbitolivorans TaxID=1867410 RepID=A0A367XXJ2_9MICO|nr:hypothetical protein [Microbacterium sorbitolivorans]RCK58326.1 hypothetical protein DTO57_09105 [Microbacterium sorbitolivorans]GGF35556.1 hypothetical protein GCM10010922_08390 [Microbacterium sorbitolivorans]